MEFNFLLLFLINLFFKSQLLEISLTSIVTEPNLGWFACAQKSQSTDPGLWWRKAQCLLQAPSRTGSPGSKDPNSLTAFRGGLFFFCPCWVFVSVRGPSLVAVSGGHSSSSCPGLSLSRPLLLPSTGSRRAGSVFVAHGPSCSAACGIFQTRARTHVPCIGRQTLNHCATREAPGEGF